MEWIAENSHPRKIGKYIVQTRTVMGNTQKLEAYWNGKSWNVSNQMVIKWLKED